MAGNLPITMRAWVFSRAGKPADILSLKKDWPMPAAPKTGEIMVKVLYASVNPADNNFMGTSIPFRGNAIPGMDFVGKVVQAGRPSTSASARGVPTVGTTVAGCIPITSALRGVGTLAEYVTVSAQAVAQKPNKMDEGLAAGIMGIAGQTSATILRHASLREGDKVLINGASGGVGTLLVHVLSGMGIHVTGICSGKNAALVQKLGAEAVSLLQHCFDSIVSRLLR
jgi:NADPH:quinone reductase-like Zn-dependent oxidoreductase